MTDTALLRHRRRDRESVSAFKGLIASPHDLAAKAPAIATESLPPPRPPGLYSAWGTGIQ